MQRKRAYRSSGLLRSLKLLRTFPVASAAILAACCRLSSTFSNDLRTPALDDNARDVAAYVDAVLGPNFVRGERVVVTHRALRTGQRAAAVVDQ